MQGAGTLAGLFFLILFNISVCKWACGGAGAERSAPSGESCGCCSPLRATGAPLCGAEHLQPGPRNAGNGHPNLGVGLQPPAWSPGGAGDGWVHPLATWSWRGSPEGCQLPGCWGQPEVPLCAARQAAAQTCSLYLGRRIRLLAGSCKNERRLCWLVGWLAARWAAECFFKTNPGFGWS